MFVLVFMNYDYPFLHWHVINGSVVGTINHSLFPRKRRHDLLQRTVRQSEKVLKPTFSSFHLLKFIAYDFYMNKIKDENF